MELETRHVVIGIIAALAIGGGYAWYIAHPEPRTATDTTAATTATSTSAQAGPAPTLYKWRDDNGVWNYTDAAPADRPYETITGTPNVNSVPTVVPESAIIETAPDAAEPAQ